MSEIIDRLTPLRAASASSVWPRVARNARTRRAMRSLTSVSAVLSVDKSGSIMLNIHSSIVESRGDKHPVEFETVHVVAGAGEWSSRGVASRGHGVSVRRPAWRLYFDRNAVGAGWVR
ncbi:hypothetical protein [Burkholderia sp. F1]|uniref:hypothetical protein n=1 Tax=Burkholderia sp. F1 TaxID=3366817 RepID=UPI003D7318CA